MAYLLGGIWSFQHRGVFLGHSAFVVPAVFLSQGIVILSYLLSFFSYGEKYALNLSLIISKYRHGQPPSIEYVSDK